MTTTIDTTNGITEPTVTVRQYSRARVLGVWAAAAVPMGVLSWVVAPAVAGPHATMARFAVSLIAALTAGLVWQFLLVMFLVAREQRSLRWRVLREALWLRAPADKTGRRQARLLWWTVPFVLGYGLMQLVPAGLHAPVNRDFGIFLRSDEAHDLLRGNWALFALMVAMFLFNTVLGEELLFRGLLLPRMQDAFGKGDWLANGVLMGLYHLHQPWGIAKSILQGVLLLAYPTKRYRSAWMGIIIHSSQSVASFIPVLLFVLS
jgi:membrane protease YdiL (CAAX protease family)